MSDEVKKGLEKAPEEGIAISEEMKGLKEGQEPEVEGQGRWFKLHCWKCGAVNTVYSGWRGFYCWNCGTINYF